MKTNKTPYQWFQVIAAIPRPSYHEQAISDFVVAFAKDRQYEVHQDAMKNVIVKAAASAGYEAAPSVILQAHMDMVAEKNDDSDHDFLTDPIELIEKSGILYANKTTLGADDGAGVAYMLAILDSDQLAHPPLECIFTVEEEVGLHGAAGLDLSSSVSELCIGLDSGGENITCITSAGGCRADIVVHTHRIKDELPTLKFSVRGLRGGHSGGMIDEQRANSIKVAGMVFYELLKSFDLYFVDLTGGLKDNAIPRECDLTVSYRPVDQAAILERFEQLRTEIIAQYKSADPDLNLLATPGTATYHASQEDTRIVSTLLFLLPFGPVYKNVDIPGHVLASANVGVVTTVDGVVTFTLSFRAAQEFVLDIMLDQVDATCGLLGLSMERNSRYGGWPYVRESKFRNRLATIFKTMRGEAIQLEASHGGLELGILKSKLPILDIITIGPKMYDIHTPNEHLDLASFDRTFEVLTAVLASLNQPL